MAKKVVIKPEDHNIEDRIIERISCVDEKDKNLLDSKFMEYLEKNNSRLYLFSEGIKNNPGKFVLVLASIFMVLAFVVLIFRNSSRPANRDGSKPPEN